MCSANAARSAWGYANESQDALARARMIRRATFIQGLGSGLGGLASAAGIYAAFSGSGGKGSKYAVYDPSNGSDYAAFWNLNDSKR